jgi:large subunit ribosomal protein L21
MGLPVLTGPFWSRPAFVAESDAESSKHRKISRFPGSRQAATGIGLDGGISMYAVIRAGGKQYRVAPGDVIRLESQGNGTNGKIEFSDVLAVSGEPGQIARPQSSAVVTGEVVEQGRGAKILVFHYKRKKQYKKLRGHRQGYTAVRITEIDVDGQKFTAPELPKKEAKPKKLKPAEVEEAPTAEAKAAKAPGKKTAARKPAANKAAPKKKK